MKRILIVGAGPSGLTMAAELARHGVRARLIDRNEGPAKESRALAVQARTLETLDLLGLSQAMVREGLPIRHAHLFADGKPLANLSFEGLKSRYPFLLSLAQSETERLLAECATGQGIEIERGVEVASLKQDADGVDVAFADGARERYAFVAGCDGAHSVVRQAVNAPFEGAEYPDDFILADVTLDWDRPRDIHLFISEKGLVGAFPLPGGKTRIIGGRPGQGKSEAAILEELRRIFDESSPFPAVIHDPVWTAAFRVHRRIVPQLGYGRCFLVGDAAHIHSPAGGQGMNTGIQDAQNLAWKLALVLAGAAEPALLDSYDAERMPVERMVLRESDVMTENALAQNAVSRWLRNHLVPLLSGIPALGHALRDLISEVSIDYHASPIVGMGGGAWSDRTDLPGGARHVLVGPRASETLQELPERWRPWIEAREWSGVLTAVRPDGYVGAQGAAGLHGYFARILR